MEAVIVTGLSGAGKSNAMNYLEDMGYYCIDNMPPALLESFIKLEQQNRISMDKAAFVMDIRGREFFGDLVRVLEELKTSENSVRVLFLEATDDALVRRFKETRRVHPLAAESILLPQQIAQEPQIVFSYDVENSFSQWAFGTSGEENTVCSVNTAQSALDLVAAGVGLCVLARECVQEQRDIRFIPLQNWHQALYMCILYDKWLEPPIWDFVELVVKSVRSAAENS